MLCPQIVVQGDDDSVYPAEYGVQIHVHSHGHESSIVRIENIEMWRAGQQGRKGRYPIYFNRIGYMRKSYVRQIGIHHAYNRGMCAFGQRQTRTHNPCISSLQSCPVSRRVTHALLRGAAVCSTMCTACAFKRQ